MGKRLLYRCHKCGTEIRGYAPVERHVDAKHGAGRIEIVFTESGT